MALPPSGRLPRASLSHDADETTAERDWRKLRTLDRGEAERIGGEVVAAVARISACGTARPEPMAVDDLDLPSGDDSDD